MGRIDSSQDRWEIRRSPIKQGVNNGRINQIAESSLVNVAQRLARWAMTGIISGNKVCGSTSWQANSSVRLTAEATVWSASASCAIAL